MGKANIPVISARKIRFENWFNTVPGVNSGTLNRDITGSYKEPEIALIYASFCAGEISKLNEIVHIIQTTQQEA